MSNLLLEVLTNPAVRTSSELPQYAANSAEEFAPWASE